MLYTLYLPKMKGDNNQFLIDTIDWYSTLTKGTNDIIVSPGYMSTTEKSILFFLESLGKLLGKGGRDVEIGLLNGMNGSWNNSTTKKTILQMHRDTIEMNCMRRDFILKNIEICPNKKPDHRKVMVFFRKKHMWDFKEKLDRSNITKFLDNIDVNAVLIGSSNQSKTTYFEPVAKKGEADIFMFAVEGDNKDEKEIIDFLNTLNAQNDSYKEQFSDSNNKYSELFNNCILSRSIYGKGNKKSGEFLKDILRNLLESGLK